MKHAWTLLTLLPLACGHAARPPTMTGTQLDTIDQAHAPAAPVTKPSEEPAPAPPAPAAPLRIEIPAPTTYPLTLLSPGAKAKRQTLAYKLQPGAKQAVRFLLNAELGDDQQTTVLPTVVLEGESEILAITPSPEGPAVIGYRIRVATLTARAHPKQTLPHDGFAAQLAALNGLVIEGDVRANGQPGVTRYELPQGSPQAKAMMQQIATLMPLWVPLPSVAIGDGARWQLRLPQATSGVALSVTLTCTLRLRADGTASIQATTSTTGEAQTLPDGVEIKAVHGEGSYAAEWSAKQLFGTQTTRLPMHLELAKGNQAGKVAMTIEPRIELP